MKQLLSIEYAKLKKLNSIKIIFLAYMVVVPLWVFFMGFFLEHEKKLRMIFPSSHTLYSFPTVWKYTVYSASYFNILMGVVIVIITCNEFSNRTWRQNIIDGMSKRNVIVSKFLVIFGISTIVTLYTAIVGFTFGCIYSNPADAYENIDNVVVYYLQTIGYFSFAFLFAVLVRKPALSIIFFIITFPVETIIGAIIKFNISRVPYQFFPLKVFADLTPIPFFEKLLAADENMKGVWIMPHSYKIVLSLFYIVLFFGLSYRILKRRDL